MDALVPKDGDVSCICRVFRKDRKVPVKCEVFFSEYDQGNSMWQSKPRVMLEKVAIARAFRLAFPVEFGGMPYESAELSPEQGLDPEKEIKIEEAVERAEAPKPEQQPQEHTGDRKAKFIEVCNKMIPAAIKDTLKAYNCRSLEELGLDQIDGFYREAKRVEAGMMQEVEF